MRYYEDFEVGETRTFGGYTITESEIIEFGEQFDPQPYHTDPEAAEESMYGGLIASGWHTTALTMRLLTEHFTAETDFLGGTAVDELRWTEPVRPGDTLGVTTEIVAKEPSTDRYGRVRTRIRVHTRSGDSVVTMEAVMLFGYRDA
ncbi:MaoC family dehydratase [Halobellus marinus]|jgi:acyl dehydratase|uniref:MaoC family dehydratase n=1 Tax=Halobellus TaxID=1073986 RepID=UPI0028AEA587|nr:MaoC family dehydratase [Halobellus sp. DFY28]